ncbi:MAG: hypothetical protein ABEH88_07505 [Halobacteriales archaeon]
MCRIALLVVVLLTLSGCSALSPTGAPLLTVDNQDDVEYSLTVYVLPDLENADELTFRATDTDGDNRSVTTAELRGNASFRNVTLDGDPAAVSRETLSAGTTTSAAINIWDPGSATVYVIETTGGTASLAGVQVITCGSRDQRHRITITDGAVSNRSITCP